MQIVLFANLALLSMFGVEKVMGGYDCYNATDAYDCVDNNCTWVGIPGYGCGFCVDPLSFGQIGCVEEDISYADEDASTYCSSGTVQQTTLCDTSGSDDSYDQPCFDIYGGTECVTSMYNCSWVRIDEYGCGVCLEPWYINQTECAEESITYDGMDSYVFCTNDTIEDRFDCRWYGNSSSDDSNDICEASATSTEQCFEIDDVCIWMEPTDNATDTIGASQCGVCVNYTLYSGGDSVDECTDGGIIAQEFGGFYSRCNASESNFNNSCFGFDGNDNDGSDDNICFWMGNAADCFMYNCSWLQNLDEDCAYCVSTAYYNETADGCQDEIEFFWGDDEYRVSCNNESVRFWNTCDDSSDDSGDSCFWMGNAGDCFMYNCSWLQNLDEDCAECVPTWYYNETADDCQDEMEYFWGDDEYRVSCNNESVRYWNTCDDSSDDSDDSHCYWMGNAADCFMYNCSWLQNLDEDCAYCVSTWDYNETADGCQDELEFFWGDDEYRVSCNNESVRYWNTCGNDSDSDDGALCGYNTASNCFDSDEDECVWIQPSTLNSTGSWECGYCLNMTSWYNGTETNCTDDALIGEAHGGWFTKCSIDDVTDGWTGSCDWYGVNRTTTEEPDIGASGNMTTTDSGASGVADDDDSSIEKSLLLSGIVVAIFACLNH